MTTQKTSVKTLKLSTASVKSVLNKTALPVAEFNEYSGLCTKEGAQVTTWQHGYSRNAIRRVTHITWSIPARYSSYIVKPMSDEEVAARHARISERLEACRVALETAGYVVEYRKTDMSLWRPELEVTLP